MTLLLPFDPGDQAGALPLPVWLAIVAAVGSGTEAPPREIAATERLLQLCAAGDRDAFRRLYERCSPRLYGIALRVAREPSLAADAVHDAFVQVWRQAGRFDPARGAADAWLATLVRYRALDIARRRRRDVLGYEPVDAPDEAPSVLDRLVGSADADLLRRCLEVLDEEKRRLIVLAFTDGLSHGELAARVGAPLGTVKSWIRRSLSTLRACLQP